VDEEEELLKQRQGYNELEEALQKHTIVEVSPPQDQIPGAHRGKRRVLLASGQVCIAKPEGGCPDSPRAAANEAAAWVVAKRLGLHHLISVTVLREIPLPAPEEGTVLAALQLFEPTYDPDRWEDFPAGETQWAALFDVIIEQTDRDGRNWIVTRDDNFRPHLKLTDHGYAFGVPGRSLRSSFHQRHRGLHLSDQMLAALRGLKDHRFTEELGALLARVDLLLEKRRLP